MADPTFPGVYTQIIDQSFLPAQQSRFRPALVGVTSKGPMNEPTVVRSLKDFLNTFGTPVAAADINGDTVNYYLADAVSLIADYTSTMTVVRVGNQYTELDSPVSAAGTSGGTSLTVSTTTATILTDLRNADPSGQLYLKVGQDAKVSSPGLLVTNVSGTTVTVDTALSDTYSGATVYYSKTASAATEAEGVLKSYVYTNKLTSFGAVYGDKNGYTFRVSSNGSNISTSAVYKLAADSALVAETPELKVKMVVNGTAYLETTSDSQTGYQALPLQATYDASNPAYLYQGTATQNAYFMAAATPGEWSNGNSANMGLYVRVRPGSKAGTKKLEIFENGALVETFDNIEKGTNPATSRPYYAEALDASQYVHVNDSVVGSEHAANTRSPWDSASYGAAVNAGVLATTGTTFQTGGNFTGGANGNNATEQDFMGSYDPVNDRYTGIRSLEDTNNVDVNLIVAPMDFDKLSGTATTRGIAIMQQLASTGRVANALAIADVPPGLNSASAVDWHNGAGRYTGRARIDDPNLAIYWNWWTMTDKFTGLPKEVPPSLAALRCFGFTFQRDQPWYAAAGETRGWVAEASAVEYERLSADARNAMYGNGNSVNPIIKINGRYYVYGERTMQRVESKLTAAHSVILVNTVVKGLAAIGRQFVFDPNDLELLVHIRLAFSEYLDKIRNQRGIEEYELVVDERNNTADTRNRREVIVDLSVIPTDVAERIFINATVRESGAQLNSVSA